MFQTGERDGTCESLNVNIVDYLRSSKKRFNHVRTYSHLLTSFDRVHFVKDEKCSGDVDNRVE